MVSAPLTHWAGQRGQPVGRFASVTQRLGRQSSPLRLQRAEDVDCGERELKGDPGPGDCSLFNGVARGPRASLVACPISAELFGLLEVSGPRDVIIPVGRASPPMRSFGRLWATADRRKHECCRNVVPGQSGRLYFVAVRPATIRTEGRCSLGASPPLAIDFEPLCGVTATLVRASERACRWEGALVATSPVLAT